MLREDRVGGDVVGADLSNFLHPVLYYYKKPPPIGRDISVLEEAVHLLCYYIKKQGQLSALLVSSEQSVRTFSDQNVHSILPLIIIIVYCVCIPSDCKMTTKNCRSGQFCLLLNVLCSTLQGRRGCWGNPLNQTSTII